MSRLTTVSTVIGILGLVMAMVSALISNVPSGILALSFVMLVMGILGAVIGAAASLGRAWQSAR